MLTSTQKYHQHSATLEVEGLPDLSKASSSADIGIISSWKLKLIGHPLLEGKKEHLDSLMSVILNYSRYKISRLNTSFSSPKNIVSIYPVDYNRHKLLLRSSQEGVNPIQLMLDDSQLVDLTRCLDDLRYDKRVDVIWSIEPDRPLPADKFLTFKRFKSKFVTPTLGFILFAFMSFTFSNFLNIKVNQDEAIEPLSGIVK